MALLNCNGLPNPGRLKVRRRLHLGADGHHTQRRDGWLLLAKRDQLFRSTSEPCQFHPAGQAALIFYDSDHHCQRDDWPSPHRNWCGRRHENHHSHCLRKCEEKRIRKTLIHFKFLNIFGNNAGNHTKPVVRRNHQTGHRQSENPPPTLPDGSPIRNGFSTGMNKLIKNNWRAHFNFKWRICFNYLFYNRILLKTRRPEDTTWRNTPAELWCAASRWKRTVSSTPIPISARAATSTESIRLREKCDTPEKC